MREATAALQPSARAVPVDLAWQLLREGRVELRRAGYRLLRESGTGVHLRAALVLAADGDPGLAHRGRSDAVRYARLASTTSRGRGALADLALTAAERVDLLTLTAQASEFLGGDDTARLTAWLSQPGRSQSGTR